MTWGSSLALMIRPERPDLQLDDCVKMTLWDASLPPSEHQFMGSSLGHL